MQKSFRVLGINPQKSYTTIGLYENEQCILERKLNHDMAFNYENKEDVQKQTLIRTESIQAQLFLEGINLSKLDAIVARGGLIRPIKGGTYLVNEAMVHDLKIGFNGRHPSNFGGLIAHEIAMNLSIPAYIVDPVVVDELNDYARLTGIPDIERKSIFHALNQKSAARKASESLNISYEAHSFIIAHLGVGITIGAHENGRVVDVNNGLNGEGPMSPERAGTIPTGDLIQLCFSGENTEQELNNLISTNSGLIAYSDIKKLSYILKQVQDNDPKLSKYIQAMSYQIAKEIGSMSTVLKGNVEAIVLTGDLAYGEEIVKEITKHTKWIADVIVYPGENILDSLVDGALRVLNKSEKIKYYNLNEGAE